MNSKKVYEIYLPKNKKENNETIVHEWREN